MEESTVNEEVTPETSEEAPFGYINDPNTGEQRPKRRPGKQRVDKPAEDVAPIIEKPSRVKKTAEPKKTEVVPMPRAGVLAAGVNKLYIRLGKLVKVFDDDIGSALISVARKEDSEDVTVGEAWEELAKTNPRLRKFLLSIVKGNSYYQLFWAHAPIFLAIAMKESIRRHIPLSRLIGGFLDDNEDGPLANVDGNPLAGLTPEDMQQAMAFASQLMPNLNVRQPTVLEMDDVG